MNDPRTPVEGLRSYLYNLAGCEDDEFVVDMLEAFLQSTADSRVQITAEADFDRLSRAAHRLKSSFATLGLADGARACALLELVALDSDALQVQTAIRVVEEQRDRADRIAQALLESLR